jgi:hypothetical protein
VTTERATGVAGATPAPRQVGGWHAAVAGWRVFVPVVLLNAGVQAALVTSDPVPATSWAFGLLVAASAAAVLVTVWLVSRAALVACDEGARRRSTQQERTGTTSRRRSRSSRAIPAGADGHPRKSLLLRRPRGLAWVAGIGVLTIAVAVLAWWATPVALIIGAFVLPPAVDGVRHPVGGGVRTVRRHPGRAAVIAVGVLALAVVTWVIELLLGFFVTGMLAAALTWVWLGVVLVLVMCWSCSLYRRATPADGPPPGPQPLGAPATTA